MQISNFIISACSFLLLLFSLHLFFGKQGNQTVNRFLSIILFTRFGQISIYLLVVSNQSALFLLFQNFFTPLYFAAPACFYLYITGFINDRRHLRKTDWLHAVPFILAVIHLLPWFFSSKDWSPASLNLLENTQLIIAYQDGLFTPYFHSVFKPLLLLGYLLATWHAVLTSPVIRQKEWDIKKTWIFFCLISASSFKMIGLAALIVGGTMNPFAAYPWFVMINSLGLLAIIVFVLHHPKILYGYLFVGANFTATASKPENTEQPNINVSPKNISLSEQLLVVYTETMTELMENEKPFLQPDFQIIHLAQKLNIPAHHCSYVVNNVIGKNFREWINSYRIAYFITMYPLLSDRMTIEAIANQSGFKSVATFYNAFKKEKGLMPTSYFAKEEYS